MCRLRSRAFHALSRQSLIGSFEGVNLVILTLGRWDKRGRAEHGLPEGNSRKIQD